MAAQDIVNRVYREFNRYTGDGLPGEPVNAPLPVGDPQSGPNNPKKSELRSALLAVLSAYFDKRGVATLAQLNAIVPPAGTRPVGAVFDDPNPANNGEYYWSGTAWLKGRDFPDTFARVSLAGSGVAQTATTKPRVNPASIEVFFAKVETVNTGPLTLSISGGAARSVVNLAGNPLSAGEWTGMVMFYLNDANQYQLLTEAGAAASAAQSATDADADRIAAQNARDAAEAFAAAAGSASGLLDRATVAALIADNVFSYTAGSGKTLVAASNVITAQGFRYEVAASGETNQHLTTAGGVKLYYLPGAEGYNVVAFGAKGNGIPDDGPAIRAAVAAIPSGTGTLFFPAGTFAWNGVLDLPARVSVIGVGMASMLRSVNDGFRTVGASNDHGLTVYRDLWMYGSGRTANRAFLIGDVEASTGRVSGFRMENVLITSYANAIEARTMWHSSFVGVRIHDVLDGIRLHGQCVSTRISGCQIVSEGAVYGDGSRGISIEAFDYPISGKHRPEAPLIDGETLVYGFDKNIDLVDVLSPSVVCCDVDYSLRIGVAVGIATLAVTIRDNYIATEHNPTGTAGIMFDGSPPATDYSEIVVAGNRISQIGDSSNSAGIVINGSNRKGVISLEDNHIVGHTNSLSFTDVTSAIVEKNTLAASVYSIESVNGGGNSYRENLIVAGIRRAGTRTRDTFENNRGGTTTCFHGPVTIPPGATIATISMASLGLTSPVTGADAFLSMKVSAYQFEGGANRGAVRARYDGAGNIIVDVATAFGVSSADIWVDMEAT